MKILHFVWASTKANGILQAVTALASEQRRLHNDILILNPFIRGEEIEGVCHVPSHHALHKAVEAFKPDIATINGLFQKEFYGIGRLLKRLNIPYLIVFHGSYSHTNYKKNTLKKAIFKYLAFNPIAKTAANVVYLSENERQNSVVKNCKPNPLIIPNGCHIPSQFAKTPPQGRPIEIAFIGRMDIWGKGLDILIGALKSLRGQNLHLSLYGPHSGNSEQWLANNLISDVATYCTPIYGKEKDNVFKKTDIIILVSRSEGFPVSILEALSYGIPCIVSPQSNVADIIKQNNCGWVTELSTQAVANTILHACREYRQWSTKLSANARAAAAQYEWNKIAKVSISLYKSCIYK